MKMTGPGIINKVCTKELHRRNLTIHSICNNEMLRMKICRFLELTRNIPTLAQELIRENPSAKVLKKESTL
jgi:hypothetical protein